MPELPEVETIRRQLARRLPLNIERVEYSQVAASVLGKRDFDPRGASVTSIRRHGKMLDFLLDTGKHIVSHLGMSGSWRLGKARLTEKHTHVQFCGSQAAGGPLYFAYVDPRRFGNILYLEEENFQKHKEKMGVDVSTAAFSSGYLEEVFKRHPKRRLKPFLLEQKHFAGVGNYMACEICARAGIRPTRQVGRIGKRERQNILSATREILRGQLQRHGLSFSGGYTDAFGNKGTGLTDLVVFHQKMCGLCGQTHVKKTILAGRGTFHCPACQT